jgi:hypothetical protein
VVGNLRITTDNGGARATALAPPKSLSLLPSEAEIPPRACLRPSLPRAFPPPSPPRLPSLLPPMNPIPVLSVPVFSRAAASNSIALPRPWRGFAAAAPALPPPDADAAASII